MKKLFLIMVAVIGFGFSANAATTKATLCDDYGRRIYLYQDGSIVFQSADGQRAEGTYYITDERTIKITWEDGTVSRGDYYVIASRSNPNDKTITCSIESATYTNKKCN